MGKEELVKVTSNDFSEAICDDYGLYYSKDFKRLLSYKNRFCTIVEKNKKRYSRIVIHPKTEIICENAFRGYGSFNEYGWFDSIKTELILPEGLKIIGNNAFTKSGISYVLIPKTIEKMIGNPFAFSNIEQIENHSVSYKIDEGILYNASMDCIVHCFTQKESFISAPNIIHISNAAFANQSKLRTVILSCVEKIGDKAFYNCPKLEYVRLSNTLRTIGAKAFKQYLIDPVFNDVDKDYFFETRKRKLLNISLSIIIPINTKHIGNEAFAHINNIKSKSRNFVIDNNLLLSADKKILYNCISSSKTVVIPDDVEYIMGAAFEGCQTIERLIIPDNVKRIGNNAFRYCYELKSVFFEANDIELGEHVFSDCVNLNTITLPSRIKDIPKGTFCNCPQIGNLVFPDTIISIGEEAFRDCGFKKLIMPKELKYIGDYAFENCTELKSLSLNNQIEEVGCFAFGSCNKIEELYLPKSLKIIKVGSFNIKNKVTITSPTTSIAENGLGGWWHELIIQIPTIYIHDMSCYHEIKKYWHIVPMFKQWTLEERLSGSNMGRFYHLKYDDYGNTIKDATKPGVYSGDMECFISLFDNFANNNINKIILNNRVKYICNNAFVKSDFGVPLYTDLGKVILPDSITAIGNNAFECCRIENLKLPKNLEYIGDFAFKNSLLDKKLIIPEKVFHIGINPFVSEFTRSKHIEVECLSSSFVVIDNIVYTSDMKRLIYCFNNNDYIKIPNKVEFIDDFAFSNLPVREISLPYSVKHIGNSAFEWCQNLEKINLINVNFIGDSCFCGCISLKKIALPYIEELNAYMFAYCKSLVSVKINKRTKTIKDFVFKDCIGLTKIILPDNISYIGESVFAKSGIVKIICKSSYFEVKNKMLFTKGLRTLVYSFNNNINVIIPEGVVEISNEAFIDKNKMEKIIFPSTLLKLGTRIFSGCTNLKLIDLSKTEIVELSQESIAFCESKPQIIL